MEALRCLLMFAIVVYHAFRHGPFLELYDGTFTSFAFCSLLAWHVDGFVAISGWYGIRFSWRKYIHFYMMVLFYGLIVQGLVKFMVWAIWGRPIQMGLSGGWFTSAYMLLMLTAPLINAAVDSLAQSGRRQLFGAWLLFAGGALLSLPPFCSFSMLASAFSSHSYLTLVLVYCTARVMSHLFVRPINMRKLAMAMLIFPVGTVILLAYEYYRQSGFSIPESGLFIPRLEYVYQYPHVYGFAIILLMIFLWHVKLPQRVGRICAFFGSSMFGVYLFHDGCISFRSVFFKVENALCEHFGISPVGSVLICAVAVFILGLAVDFCRRGFFLAVESLVSSALDWMKRKFPLSLN